MDINERFSRLEYGLLKDPAWKSYRDRFGIDGFFYPNHPDGPYVLFLGRKFRWDEDTHTLVVPVNFKIQPAWVQCIERLVQLSQNPPKYPKGYLEVLTILKGAAWQHDLDYTVGLGFKTTHMLRFKMLTLTVWFHVSDDQYLGQVDMRISNETKICFLPELRQDILAVENLLAQLEPYISDNIELT